MLKQELNPGTCSCQRDDGGASLNVKIIDERESHLGKTTERTVEWHRSNMGAFACQDEVVEAIHALVLH